MLAASAAVPLLVLTPCAAPTAAAKASSSSATRGPGPSQFDFIVSSTAANSRWVSEGRATGIIAGLGTACESFITLMLALDE